MLRRVALVLLALAGAACGSDEGVAVHVTGTEVRDGATPKVALLVSVRGDCFFSVLLNGDLKASGRWATGSHEVLIPGNLLLPAGNVVRIDVAGEDGSSARVEEAIDFCETGAILCGGELPEPDGGVPDPDGGGLYSNLCALCAGDEDCGGLPNECVFLYPDEPGQCGTYCGDDYTCPYGFVCTQFEDPSHISLLCFPPGPDFDCP